MKDSSSCNVVFLSLLLLLLPLHVSARRVGFPHSRHAHHHQNQVTPDHHGAAIRMAPGKERVGDTVQVPGSRLPDCTHACGSCSPCRLVMVSFICATEAETCPMAYKCMCNNKSYPVP